MEKVNPFLESSFESFPSLTMESFSIEGLVSFVFKEVTSPSEENSSEFIIEEAEELMEEHIEEAVLECEEGIDEEASGISAEGAPGGESGEEDKSEDDLKVHEEELD